MTRRGGTRAAGPGRLRTALLLLVAAGCRGPAPAAAEAPARSAIRPETEARFLEACAAGCERSQMKRAVGAEVIEAECRASCEADWALPLVRSGPELSAQVGQRVRVRGVSIEGALRLPDGSSVTLHGATMPPSGQVIASGTAAVEGGAFRLEHVAAAVAD